MEKFIDFIINDFEKLTDFEKKLVFRIIIIKWEIYKKELPDKI